MDREKVEGFTAKLGGTLVLVYEADNSDISGYATVWATGTIDGQISGSGNVKYYGRPQTSVSISGSGKIESLGEK